MRCINIFKLSGEPKFWDFWWIEIFKLLMNKVCDLFDALPKTFENFDKPEFVIFLVQ